MVFKRVFPELALNFFLIFKISDRSLAIYLIPTSYKTFPIMKVAAEVPNYNLNLWLYQSTYSVRDGLEGRRDNLSNTSWLLVGAIGFEPMTSTV